MPNNDDGRGELKERYYSGDLVYFPPYKDIHYTVIERDFNAKTVKLVSVSQAPWALKNMAMRGLFPTYLASPQLFWWPIDLSPKDPTYPHVCPRCNGPAFVGFLQVDCKKGCEFTLSSK